MIGLETERPHRKGRPVRQLWSGGHSEDGRWHVEWNTGSIEYAVDLQFRESKTGAANLSSGGFETGARQDPEAEIEVAC